MAAINILNPKAEYAKAAAALAISTSAAKGIMEVMKTNLGPKGTMKMLVSGAGDIKITKDGNILLHEMQIQHPIASFIARVSTAQDEMVGDGTTSTVLLIGAILLEAENLISSSSSIHPRAIVDGLNVARDEGLKVIDDLKVAMPKKSDKMIDVARSAIRTKVHHKIADHLAEMCANAFSYLDDAGGMGVDLNMVEIMDMQHRSVDDSCLVKGLVMDHGGRHPDMPKQLSNVFILTCNVSLEYEKTEVNAGFFYKNAGERERMLQSERHLITGRVMNIIALKRSVCQNDEGFLLVNQKGIDPLSLDLLAKEGIIALRRAKRRNMERLTRACGGQPMNDLTDLSKECLGWANSVYEHVVNDNAYTFVEECKEPKSVTILLKGPTKYQITQMKDALKDGLKALNNVYHDQFYVLPGAGAFELAVHSRLAKLPMGEWENGLRPSYGIQILQKAILSIPKALLSNAGWDAEDVVADASLKYSKDMTKAIGLDLDTGKTMDPLAAGIYDGITAKVQMVAAAVLTASTLLLTDEIMRAGLSSLKG